MAIKYLLAITLLAGTIIGAGIFSLPYIFNKIGLITGLIYLIFFTFIYFLIHLMYAQVLAVQEKDHQVFYLAHKYLPKKIAEIFSWVILIELVFVMLVYLVLAPNFSKIVFGSEGLGHLLGFWFFSSLFIFGQISVISLTEFIGVMSVLGIISIVILVSFFEPLTVANFQKLNWELFFLPFGPLLFSLSGRPALHKVIEIYRQSKIKNKKLSLPLICFLGTLLPAFVYFVFVVSVLKLNPEVSPEALNSLNFLPLPILKLLGVLGLITLWTSYFMIGSNVKDFLYLDLKKPFWFSAFFVLFTPLFLYFLGFKEFLKVISFTGSIFLALEAIFVLILWQRVFPKKILSFFVWPLYLIFLISMINEIFHFFK